MGRMEDEYSYMGYSATQDAIHALAVIHKAYGDPSCSNVLILHGERYFYEIGRENEDGAVTARLIRMMPSEPGIRQDYAFPAAPFLISPDGVIQTFPKLANFQTQNLN